MILYKYFGPERLVDVLRDRLIRFTQPAEFNDPFEFQPAFGELFPPNIVPEYLETNLETMLDAQIAASLRENVSRATREEMRAFVLARQDELRVMLSGVLKAVTPALRAKLPDAFFTAMNARAGVLCLSEVRDSLLMWGHYADCHRGFVVGFDAEHPFFQKRRGPKDELGFLRRVEYRGARPLLTLQPTDSISIDLFQTKAAQWAYEKEWRMMRALSEATKRIETAPYPVCLFEFDREAVKEIIVGMRADTAMLDAARSLAGAFPRALLLRARTHPAQYALVIE